MSRSSFTLAAILLLLAGCDRAVPEPAQGEGALAGQKASLAGEVDRSQAGEPIPAETIALPGAEEQRLDALAGQPLLVNLWATWCAPCKKEMPLLDALAIERAGELRVLTVSQDRGGADKVLPYFEESRFAALEPWLDPEGRLGDHFGASLPVTVLFDGEGREVWRIVGDYDWSSAEASGLLDEGLD